MFSFDVWSLSLNKEPLMLSLFSADSLTKSKRAFCSSKAMVYLSELLGFDEVYFEVVLFEDSLRSNTNEPTLMAMYSSEMVGVTLSFIDCG